MEKDCPTLQLNKDAMDLSEWRKLIKDIGKDREWMDNVLSGAGLTGYPG